MAAQVGGQSVAAWGNKGDVYRILVRRSDVAGSLLIQHIGARRRRNGRNVASSLAAAQCRRGWLRVHTRSVVTECMGPGLEIGQG